MRNYAKLYETMRNYATLSETMRNYAKLLYSYCCIFTIVCLQLYFYYCNFLFYLAQPRTLGPQAKTKPVRPRTLGPPSQTQAGPGIALMAGGDFDGDTVAITRDGKLLFIKRATKRTAR